jgi:hypothetical protein
LRGWFRVAGSGRIWCRQPGRGTQVRLQWLVGSDEPGADKHLQRGRNQFLADLVENQLRRRLIRAPVAGHDILDHERLRDVTDVFSDGLHRLVESARLDVGQRVAATLAL